jgi:hypothetical protein
MIKWDNLNIHIITIPSTDTERIKNELSTQNISNYNIHTFQPAEKTINGGSDDLKLIDIISHKKCDSTCQNLTKNHINIILEEYEKKSKFVTIFEDDFEFDTISSSKSSSIQKFIDNNNWDIFYFGFAPWPVLFSIPICMHIIKPITPLLAHAYILSRSGMEKVLKYYNKNANIHIDKLFVKAKLYAYAPFPSFIHQKDPPALYIKSFKKMGISSFNHKTVFRVTEYISLILFFIVIIILIVIIYKIIKKVV